MKDKKTFILSLVAIITLVIMVVGATYAFFQGQFGSNKNVNVNVTTATTDVFTFETGSNIAIEATQQNFASGKGNLSGSTFAKATLKANNSTNNATYNYYVYFDIEDNNYVYTTSGKTAELILTVTDPDGNAVTSIDGLNYVTSGGVSGFDITTKTGLITIADNYAITSTGTKTQNWTLKVTFVNLDSDQHLNEGKSFSGTIMTQKEKIMVYPVYWNDGFSGSTYTFSNTPATTYTSPTQLIASTPYQRSYYIKTTATEHQVCLYYNDREFCLKANYWDTDVSTTETKLQNEMASALGVDTSELSCYSGSCELSGFYCNVHSNGSVSIDVLDNGCGVNSDGIANCSEW